MKREVRTYRVRVSRNATEVINEFDLFISACDGISVENLRYSEWGHAISVTVSQRGSEVERVESMRIGDVIKYKGYTEGLFEIRLMSIETDSNKSATFEVCELSASDSTL